jgi:hypothetical protein
MVLRLFPRRYLPRHLPAELDRQLYSNFDVRLAAAEMQAK